jgi:hypothetical protein
VAIQIVTQASDAQVKARQRFGSARDIGPNHATVTGCRSATFSRPVEVESPWIRHFLGMECILQCSTRCRGAAVLEGRAMDPKITILLLLIAAIIALSHLNDENLGRWWRQVADRRWRELVPTRRRT